MELGPVAFCDEVSECGDNVLGRHDQTLSSQDSSALLETFDGVPPDAPPRVRGEGRVADHRRTRNGRTPARAGRSSTASPVPNASWAHPRACGEKPMWTWTPMPSVGAPPRVRGEEDSTWVTLSDDRRTPARAGRSLPPDHLWTAPAAHPRACGEKLDSCAAVINAIGAPPRVRGEVLGSRVRDRRGRRTPARAGRSRKRAGFKGLRGAHPRACGEKMPSGRITSCQMGAPPRVRGEGAVGIS